jgi:spore maturation protein SpmA/spore maturation protein SpmB
MLNALWFGLILLAVLLGLWQGTVGALAPAAFEAARNAVMTIALPLAGIMALWLGFMRLAEKAGLIAIVARVLRPVLVRLFPDVPARHPAMGAMVMNMAANMLGLSNAATPLGLRAMQDLEKINPHPGTASNAMCTFLAINTSSVQLIPATAVAILATAQATQPTVIIGTAFVATLCSTIVGLVTVKSLERLPAYRLAPPAPERAAEVAQELARVESDAAAAEKHPWKAWQIGVVFLLLGAFFWAGGQSVMTGESVLTVRLVETISLLAIPFLFALFPLVALLRGVPVYEEFVEGAKEGMTVALRIIPFLVAILVAIAMFRAVGGIELLGRAFGGFLELVGVPLEILPLMMVRPLSGSAALGIFSEIAQTHGGDSFIARLAGTLMGSTETTFYVLAVYFGSVAVRRTRHAVPSGLAADLAGMTAAVIICHWTFGGS